MNRIERVRELLKEEIRPVVGCTEPASIAFAFAQAVRNLKTAPDLKKLKAELYLSEEVFRNASTVYIPVLRKKGIEYAAAGGIVSLSEGFNPFARIKERKKEITRLTARKGWLRAVKLAEKGIYVKAVLRNGSEKAAVEIRDRHDRVEKVWINGRVVFSRKKKRLYEIKSLEEVRSIVVSKDRRLLAMAEDFMMRQGSRLPSGSASASEGIFTLIEKRMLGTGNEIMTITGSGNQGIFLSVPFYVLYRKGIPGVLDGMLFSLLTQIYMTQKKSRISSLCGLGTKAAPSLLAGMLHRGGVRTGKIKKAIMLCEEALKGLVCEGAVRTCAFKGHLCLKAVERILADLGFKAGFE